MKEEDVEDPLDGIEFFEARIIRCPVCGDVTPAYAGELPEDDTCCHMEPTVLTDDWGWWFWFCQPGCLPDSDPFGPWETYREAVVFAQELYMDDSDE